MGLNNLIQAKDGFCLVKSVEQRASIKNRSLIFFKDSLRESIQSVGLQHLSRLLVLG